MATRIDSNSCSYLKIYRSKFRDNCKTEGLTDDFTRKKHKSLLNNNFTGKDPFSGLQLSSHTRPRLKPVINNNRRSPLLIKSRRPLENPEAQIRCSKSEESLATIFKPRSSKLKIKVINLPPLPLLPFSKNFCEKAPDFKVYAGGEQKEADNKKFFDKVKRKTNNRLQNHSQNQDLANITFSGKFKSVFTNPIIL